MSGHSKFANIKHKKEKNDAAKGKIFTIIGREIAVAVKEGGPDPSNNFKLAKVIEKAKSIDLGEDGQKSLDYLKELYMLLCDAGLENKIVIDLSLVNRTNYYTGIIFKGYLQGSGVSVVSGGRYDCLGAEFGRDMPSTGFGIETGALASVMLSRNELDEEKIPGIIVFGEQDYIVKALEYSKNLRANDVYCENSTFETLAETKEYALSKGIKKVCVVGETVREEIL